MCSRPTAYSLPFGTMVSVPLVCVCVVLPCTGAKRLVRGPESSRRNFPFCTREQALCVCVGVPSHVGGNLVAVALGSKQRAQSRRG